MSVASCLTRKYPSKNGFPILLQAPLLTSLDRLVCQLPHSKKYNAACIRSVSYNTYRKFKTMKGELHNLYYLSVVLSRLACFLNTIHFRYCLFVSQTISIHILRFFCFRSTTIRPIPDPQLIRTSSSTKRLCLILYERVEAMKFYIKFVPPTANNTLVLPLDRHEMKRLEFGRF